MAIVERKTDQNAACKLYEVNHTATTDPLGDEYFFWSQGRALAGLAVPWGSGGVGATSSRADQITAAAAALAITLPALGGAALVGPYQREESFWSQWRALPPTPLA